ncbi:hypothetical protein ABVK25_006076 [Lepraria finkii]|uniref:Rhodopsin domain-containing protein n=1 Tax=Lepraria finkii TaxID=1340010 RepID=A0ABR4B7D6_9LECA
MALSGPPTEGDVNKSAAIRIYTGVLISFTILTVTLRFIVRKWVTKIIGWDDWTILLALLGNVIGFGLVHVEIHYGFGQPQYYLTEWELIEFRKYAYGEWIQTFATLMWTKVSICLFLRRIPVTKALIKPLEAAIVFLILSNVIVTVLWIIQCRPVDAAWNSNVQGSCFSRGQLERIILAQAIISVVSDFTFAAYPILILWKTQMKLSTKVGLCCLMGLGVLTGACCIVRTVLNFQSLSTDLTYGGITNWYWRTFEVQMGIIAACAPTLRPGWRWLYYKLKGRNAGKGHTLLTDEV